MPIHCAFCNSEIIYFQATPHTTINNVECPVCKKYQIEDFNQLTTFEQLNDNQKAMISTFARELYEQGSSPPMLHLLSEEQIKRIIERYENKTVVEKLNNLILYLGNKSNYYGDEIEVNIHEDYPITYSINHEEFHNILSLAKELGYIYLVEVTSSRQMSNLLLRGWEKFEELKKHENPSKNCFIAMACNLDEVYRTAIKPVIEGLGYNPIFIEEEQYNEKICDMIIAEIRSCRFLIADVTGQRQNVYYEAGFAQGMNIDVIWTCRASEIDNVHFDTRQYNHIVWENENDLKDKLRNRIRATII